MNRQIPVLAALSLAIAAAITPATSTAQGWFGSRSSNEASKGDILAQASDLAARQDPWLRPFASTLYREGEWGAVLNLQRLGLAAMEMKRFDLARKAFDQAIVRVEAIYADDPNAARARSLFNAEKVKDWKGEPYERAMLYYYRGLLYVQEGDWQNARASFLAADRHDTLSSAEDKAFPGSFGLMKYLAAWASQCDGDAVRAGQLLEESRAADAKIAALRAALPRALVIVESGTAPEKWGDGAHKEILRFRAATGVEPTAVVTAGGQAVPLRLAGDLVVQATTRGGREVDGIMAGKARFKDTAGTVGDVAVQGGMNVALLSASMGDRGGMNAGLAGMFIGLIAKGVEAATTPAADVRAWDTLPAKVWLAEGVPNADPVVTVDGVAREPWLLTSAGNCSIASARTRSALGREMGGGATMRGDETLEASRGERNRAFRTMVAGELLATR